MHPDPVFSRRDFVKSTSVAALVSTSTCTVSAGSPNETTSIGTRRELFVENTLISQIHGGAQLRLHQPVPREVSFVCDLSLIHKRRFQQYPPRDRLLCRKS